MEIVQTVVLALTGLFLVFIGTLRISNPIANYAKNSGIKLENDVNLLNEMRGVSAVMLCAGIIIGLGALISAFAFTSFVVGALLFLGFAIGRFVGWAVDGKPNKQISQGIMFELVFGAAHLFCLLSILM